MVYEKTGVSDSQVCARETKCFGRLAIQERADNPHRVQGFFWPVLTTDIRSCSQCQKVCFFPNLNKKIPNSRNKKKTREKITKYHHFTMFMFVVERAGPNSPNDTREITKYCKLPNGNVTLRQFSRIYSRRCRGVCNKHTCLFYWYPTLAY